jgi:hypothetical protein
MPEINTTPPKKHGKGRKRESKLDPAALAAMNFEPWAKDGSEEQAKLDTMFSLEEIQAKAFYGRIATAMMYKSKSELAEAMDKLGEDAALGVVDGMLNALNYYEGAVKLIEGCLCRLTVASAGEIEDKEEASDD